MASGLFERVNTHEPKNAPGSGLTAAIWADRIRPVPSGSGLSATSGMVVYMARLYTNMLQEPQDAIDPALVATVDAVLSRLTVDFTLGGAIKNIDLLGQTGTTLEATAGYVNIGGTLYRVMDITIPCIVNDAWTQGA
jgi:hypothetical protein